jgi:hypothetical protein
MREDIKYNHLKHALFLTLLIILICLPGPLMARNYHDANGNSPDIHLKPTADGIPDTRQSLHDVGNIRLLISNFGYFGNPYFGAMMDPESGESYPSCEYPAYSGIENLFLGSIWIGGIVDYDSLVSVGYDGWQWVQEMYPDAYPDGVIIERSTIMTDPAFHPEAFSEQDFIAEYTDTLCDPAFVSEDPDDDRPHIPLNVKIQQRSYAWSQKYAEDFIFFDFTVSNIGEQKIKRAYIGIYIDADVWHPLVDPDGFEDDICGFKRAVPCGYGGYEDTINLAWVADADGDPNGNYFDYASPLAATGIRLLNCSNPNAQLSFNWWVSDLDWGPVEDEWLIGGLIGPCQRGIPPGDACKYDRMSNGEIDYDQIYAAIDYSDLGWFPPPSLNDAINLANGYDIRYLYSFGPFDINPGDSAAFTLAYVGGDNFHDRPDDFRNYFDDQNPDNFYSTLDFSDLASNAIWAGWVYDNPGVDTDGDGKRGRFHLVTDVETGLPDTVYYAGDGIPDYAGPPPPPSPTLRFETGHSRVKVKWNGLETETYRDPFTNTRDFEGYRVYMTDDPASHDFALLSSYDLTDFHRYTWDVGKSKWLLKDPPFTLDSLRALYNDDELAPLNYSQGNPYIDTDGNHIIFKKIDWNCPSGDGTHSIRKTYWENIYPRGYITSDTGRVNFPQNYVKENGVYYHKYYEYEITIGNLKSSEPVYFAVTAFDYGYYQNQLEPLESSPHLNVREVYPLNPADSVEAKGLQASVYPNPYRIDAEYNLRVNGQRIYFINLPGECVIKIWTQDGDLARTINHYPGGPFSETDTKAFWDLRNGDNEEAVSGIYIYTIESETDSQIGKLVVIK